MKKDILVNMLLKDNVGDYLLEKNQKEIEDMFGKDVAEMVGYDQRNPHHCYDLFEHTLNTVEGINTNGMTDDEIAMLKVAAFFHDIGKPKVAFEKKGRLVFYGHAKKSREIAEPILESYGFEKDEISKIGFYIEHHDDFISFKRNDEEWDRKNKSIKEINRENVAGNIQKVKEKNKKNGEYNPTERDYQLLFRLCKADANAQSRIVRMDGNIVDSKSNKVDRMSKIEDVFPFAYKVAEIKILINENNDLQTLYEQVNKIMEKDYEKCNDLR